MNLPHPIRPRRPLGHGHRTARPGSERERGAVVVLAAGSLVALLLVAALVVDGSQAYPQRRRAQNAADAAAMAGARAMDQRMWFGGTDVVEDVVNDVAGENGADDVTCTYITPTGADIADCADHTTPPATAAGVRVRTGDERTTTFRRLSGRESITARGQAAATVQKVTGVAAPFIVCGSDDVYPNPSPPGRDLLVTDEFGDTVYREDGTAMIDVAKAEAAGRFALQGSEPRVPNCGAGSQFDGKGGDDPVSIPSWTQGDSGGGFENETQVQVLGAEPCPYPVPSGLELSCDILLPIADKGLNGKLYVVAFGVFHVTGNGLGNPKYWAEFRAELNHLSGGTTNTDLVAAHDIRVIRLIE